MDITSFIELKETSCGEGNHLHFTREELTRIRADEALHLIRHWHGRFMFELPEQEIAFFDWLKIKDPGVWDDLWTDAADGYLVSIDLLREFLPDRTGFPICDLLNHKNYWFTAGHIKPPGLEHLQLVLNRIEQDGKMTVAEHFLLEMSTHPVDIWHFCYTNKLDIPKVKKVIDDMVYKGWIVHLPRREDLIRYIDF